MSNAIRDYLPTAQAIAADIVREIEDGADSFNVRLYKPIQGTEEAPAGITDVVGAIESNVREMELADATYSRAMIIPPDPAGFPAYNAGYGALDTDATPVVFLFSDPAVPVGTVVEYDEVSSKGMVSKTYYVLTLETIGTAPDIYAKCQCIPAHDGMLPKVVTP